MYSALPLRGCHVTATCDHASRGSGRGACTTVKLAAVSPCSSCATTRPSRSNPASSGDAPGPLGASETCASTPAFARGLIQNATENGRRGSPSSLAQLAIGVTRLAASCSAPYASSKLAPPASRASSSASASGPERASHAATSSRAWQYALRPALRTAV